MITIWVPKRLVEVDLYNVAARSPQALARLSENSYARRVQYAAQKVRGSGAKIVMLTGPSASGKTTSAHCLAKALVQQGTPAQVVSLDNFFKGAAYYPKMPDGTLDYENLETLDLPLIKQCLHQLSETGKTELPIYDFATEQRAAAVEPIDLQGGVCIVEGIHALNPELTGLVPDDQIYRIYAGLREEYCIDGRRVINTQDIRLCCRSPRPQPRQDPFHVGQGAGRRDPVYQGLQDHRGFSAGHLLYLRAGTDLPAAGRGAPSVHAGGP